MLSPFYESEDKKTKVYEVTVQNPLNREVIVKQVECDSEDSAARAMEEGRIAKANPHPNICPCLDFVKETKEDGSICVYIISPKMPKSLQDEIQQRIDNRNYFTEEELQRLTTQLITAYAFLQEKVIPTQNIAHRDIKPHNILLDPEGNVKVCDFGFAKVIEGDVHTLLGTKPYFSPALRKAYLSGEQEFHRVQHNVFKSDVYSLGICLGYAAIFESPDFLTVLHLLQEHITARLNRLTRYSQTWVNILRQMLTVNETMRPDFITLKNSLSSPLRFADDELIEGSVVEEGLQNPLQVTVKCGLGHVRVSPTLTEEVPCMISLKAGTVDPNHASYSNDIVAVIDQSRSMGGSRIRMVQQSLMKLIAMLGQRDRVCIVTFSDTAERKCPLICCSQAGKETLGKIVMELKGVKKTNISAGFVMGMEVLEQRRMKNVAASVLLLSDGKNNQGPDPLPICLEKCRNLADSKITVHVFGYSEYVDAKLLEALAAEGKGVFHHITEIQQIETTFALAYGHLTSVVGRNMKVAMEVKPGTVKCSIPKIYSKDGTPCFSLPDIAANQQKDMVFTLKAERQALVKAINFEPVAVNVEYEDNEGTGYHQTTNMSVKFVPWSDVAPNRDLNVFVNWYRVKGANFLREARLLAEDGQLAAADGVLRDGIELLEDSGFRTLESIAAVIRDLNQARDRVQSNEAWQRGGDAHFASISYSHYSQSASVLAMHYSSEQQKRSVEAMRQMQISAIPDQ